MVMVNQISTLTRMVIKNQIPTSIQMVMENVIKYVLIITIMEDQ